MIRLLFLSIFIPAILVAQSEATARAYYQNGDFEKAIYEYKRLHEDSGSNLDYISKIVSCYQQLEQYKTAETFLLQIIQKTNYPPFYVELGFNYQLQGNTNKASENYAQAINSLSTNVNYAYPVARAFQNHTLLNEAISTYEKAMVLKPSLNLKLPLAQIYGEQGNIEKMMLNYIEFAQSNPIALPNIKREVGNFINEDATNSGNNILRKLLIKKIQQEPDLFWNEMLSWMFVQQKEFEKAFAQEKAIYARAPESLSRILDLAIIAKSENEYQTAKTIYNYVLANAQDSNTKLTATHDLLQIEIEESDPNMYKTIEAQFLEALNAYGKTSQTFQIQIAYAHFLAFYMNKAQEASTFLEEALALPLTTVEKAEIKLELGDILLLQEQFNKALIYYTQIQRNLKNSTISQKARFKVAKASYYKGDFKWAESQLKILKSSTSQLIANDALDLKLLITDNKYEDSLQTALKLYAKADLLAFQNKTDAAIAVLNQVLDNHKTEPIIPQALFKQAQLYTKQRAFNNAVANYEYILENYKDNIVLDNATYHLAELYKLELNNPEKAMALYKSIVFNYADSIYFVDARKKFRALRGDTIN